METRHWVFLLIVFVVGYFVGVKFPSAGSSISGIIPSVTP